MISVNLNIVIGDPVRSIQQLKRSNIQRHDEMNTLSIDNNRYVQDEHRVIFANHRKRISYLLTIASYVITCYCGLTLLLTWSIGAIKYTYFWKLEPAPVCQFPH